MTEGIDRRRRLLIGTSVAATAGLAIVAWLLLNFLLTRPGLRTSIDLTRNAQFTVSDATKQLIQALREDPKKKLQVYTLFIPARDLGGWRAGIQSRILRLTHDLLERVSYLGGDSITVEHIDIKHDIKHAREAGGQPNTIVLQLGKRKRVLNLWQDMGDIRFPEGQQQPGQMSIPVLEGYRGESAFASVLKELLTEGTPVVYSLTNHGELQARNPGGDGCQMLSTLLRGQGLKFVEWDLAAKREIPADCAVLLMLQPRRFVPAEEIKLIRAYIESGGRVVVTLAHPLGMSYTQVAPMRLDGLLEPCGIEIGDDWLLNGIPQGNEVSVGAEFVTRVRIRKGLNAAHPVTGFLRRNQSYVDLIGARAVTFKNPLPDGVVGDYLLTTNPFTWKANLARWPKQDFYAPVTEALYGTFHVAAIAEVTATDGQKKNGRLAVIGGLAFANGDHLIEDNQVFATKLIDWLARRKSLVSVPSTNYRSQAMRASPTQLGRVAWLVFTPPVLFLLLAVFVVFWRRRA